MALNSTTIIKMKTNQPKLMRKTTKRKSHSISMMNKTMSRLPKIFPGLYRNQKNKNEEALSRVQ